MADGTNMGWTMELDGFDLSFGATVRLAVEVGNATAPIIQEFAQTVKKGSIERIMGSRHPSGIFPKTGSPRYKVRRTGRFYYKVETPPRPWGSGTAMAELAREPRSKQGDAMIRALDASFGKANRVMYSVYDRHEPEYMARFTAAIAKVEGKTNKATE